MKVAIPQLTLADSHTIPQLGLGLWKVKDPAQFNTAFEAAVAAGYRHFDSAQAYDNEHLLGAAWQRAGLKREDIFITTKIAVEHFGHKHVMQTFQDSLQKLQTDYVDLLLLHFPVTLLRKKSWQALEAIQVVGGAKSIGVSNYTIRHLQEMKQYAKAMPVINQVELHVFLQQPELIQYCQDHDITVEAYSPLAHGQVMDDPVVADIAKKHGKSYAQIMLRWCIEQQLVVVAKSVTPERIRQNIDIFDFKLDASDLEALTKLDRDLRTCWSPVHVP
jgi:diketogulonate reductase-like aldo/keto reductase